MAAEKFAPTRSTGIGSWPGEDMAEALRITFDECPELPYLPELPARGIGSGIIGRGMAILSGMFADVQPAGWRLTDAAGRDQLRARALVRDDRDQLEEAVQDYTGLFKISVVGPWTLAGSVERPRGDRVLADHGARRDLGQSLAEGIGELVGDLTRRLPQLDLVVQIDEPLLPAVLAGQVPTASGFSSHRKIDQAEVSAALTWIADAVTPHPGPAPPPVPTPHPEPEPHPEPTPHPELVEGPPRTWLHSCAAGVPVKLIKEAGIGGIALDLDQLSTADWDTIGQAMSDGLWLGAGGLSTSTGGTTDRQWSPDTIAQRVLRAMRTLGLDPSVAGQMIITPACGLARFDQRSAVNALRAVRKAADIVTDQLAD